LDFEDKLLKALLNKLYLVKKKDKYVIFVLGRKKNCLSEYLNRYVIFVLGRKKEIICQNT
jgi:hypothetical protein